MPQHHFLAIDLGAETGKAFLGTLKNRATLDLEEIHRFPTGHMFIGKHYYWNIHRFYEEVITALNKCVIDLNVIPQSIGVDSWGADFGLIGEDGSLLRIPYCYRDTMTETAIPAFLDRMPRNELYGLTGIALHKFNTLFQLYAMVMADDPVLKIARKLLFIPDLINYLLTGEARTEFTYSTTSQLYNPHLREWEGEIFNQVGLSTELMQEVVDPGEVIGELNPNISRSIDVEGIKVIAVTSHDIASSVVSVPATTENWVFITSGMRSVMGVENSETIIDSRTMLFNFSNEGGAGSTFRFSKNIMGLWLLQQCKHSWTKNDRGLDYPEIVSLAEMAHGFTALVDPDYPGFFNPLDMPAAIDTYCRQTNQTPPVGIGPVARSILEGIALKYRLVLDQLEQITARTYDTIHIIGGGSENRLLCQFTANATGRRIVAGPAQATGTGNLLMQAIGLGYLRDLQHAREVVVDSFEFREYQPKDKYVWEEAYLRFKKVARQN